jgi:hypothetical protein
MKPQTPGKPCKCSMPGCRKKAIGWWNCWAVCNECYTLKLKRQRSEENKALKEARQ